MGRRNTWNSWGEKGWGEGFAEEGKLNEGGTVAHEKLFDKQLSWGQSLSWMAWRSSSVALATSCACLLTICDSTRMTQCWTLEFDRLTEFPLPNLGRGIRTRWTSLSHDSMLIKCWITSLWIKINLVNRLENNAGNTRISIMERNICSYVNDDGFQKIFDIMGSLKVSIWIS